MNLDVPPVPRVSGKQDADQHLVRLGSAIKASRKALGLTQDALADAAGIERAHLGKIERGERNVTMLNIVKIAAAMDQKPSDILAAADL